MLLGQLSTATRALNTRLDLLGGQVRGWGLACPEWGGGGYFFESCYKLQLHEALPYDRDAQDLTSVERTQFIGSLYILLFVAPCRYVHVFLCVV